MKRSAKMSSAGNASYVATLYHLKRFLGTKRIKLNTLFRLKRFRGTQGGAPQLLAAYAARFGQGDSDEQARRDAPSFMTFAERRRFELLIPFRGIHAFQACLLSHSSISPITTLSAYETRKQDCKYTNYL